MYSINGVVRQYEGLARLSIDESCVQRWYYSITSNVGNGFSQLWHRFQSVSGTAWPANLLHRRTDLSNLQETEESSCQDEVAESLSIH